MAIHRDEGKLISKIDGTELYSGKDFYLNTENKKFYFYKQFTKEIDLKDYEIVKPAATIGGIAASKTATCATTPAIPSQRHNSSAAIGATISLISNPTVSWPSNPRLRRSSTENPLPPSPPAPGCRYLPVIGR